mgnify:CR=1 FL=1
MRPSAGVYERIRQQHHLRLQCRRKAHFQNDQRHNVQLLLLGRSADGDDLGQQQVALYLRLHWPGVCDVQRQQVFLPEKCPRRCHRSCQCQRHPGGVLHLRPLGCAHVHRRHHRLGGDYVFKPLLESLGKSSVGTTAVTIKNIVRSSLK